MSKIIEFVFILFLLRNIFFDSNSKSNKRENNRIIEFPDWEGNENN